MSDRTTPGGPVPVGRRPPTNLVWGVLTTLLCCQPLGIVSIVYAARVDPQWRCGDVAAAGESSRRAARWAIAAASSVAVLALLVVTLDQVAP